jgi:glutamate/tyrosine decarboxylase-like PLP-dependent enzyme
MSEDESTSLEPSAELHREWLDAAGDFVLAHIGGLEDRPARGLNGAEGRAIAERESLEIPELPHAGGLSELLEKIETLSTACLNTPGPGYLAYVPGGGLFAAALADLIANCTNRFTGLAAAAPGFARLEADVLAWLCREFGYADTARGLLTSGGSLANFSAIVTARHARFGDSGNYAEATAYTSNQAHNSVAKSLRMAGIPAANLRSIATDDRYRLDIEALARAVEADRQAGMKPFLVVAAGGTTNTGAIDPLPELAGLCGEQSLWLHVDAAYGGAFVLCPRGRQRLAGIEKADSITFDPHKGMFLPYGTGCLLVRDGEALRSAHRLHGDYLQDLNLGATPNPAEYGPELSRDFRGLRLWLPLMLHGAGAFRDALEEKLALAELFHAGLEERVEAGAPIEIVASPQLSAVAFRLRRLEDESVDDCNQRNVELQERINDENRVYLSSTMLPGEEGPRFTLRVCILSFRTHRDRIAACLEDLDRALQSIARSQRIK